MVFLQHQQQLADGEHADDDHHELDAVGEVDIAAGEAVDAGVRIQPDAGHREADEGGQPGLDGRVAHEPGDAGEGETHEREVLGRPEGQRPARQQRRHQHDADGGHQ
ncbi:hypothetical protein D3C72_2019910 [compost metagenome]